MNQDKGLTIRDILNVIFKRVMILWLVVILVPLGVLLACLVATPVYKTDAKVIITSKKDQASLLEPAGPGPSRVLNLNVDEIDQNSEMEILRSPDLWLKTVQALGPGFFKKEDAGLLSKIVSGLKNELQNVISPAHSPQKDDDVQLMRNKAIAESLLTKFEVTPVPRSKVLDLTLKDSDPVRVRDILVKLLDVYVPFHSHVYSLPGAQEFFSEKLIVAKEKYELARSNLTEFKTKWNLSVPERQETELITTLKMIEDSIIDIDSNLKQYKEMRSLLERGDTITGQLSPGTQRGNESTLLNVMGVQLLQIAQKQIQIAEIFTAESRDFRAVSEQYRDQLSTFESGITSETAILAVKKASLEVSRQRVLDQMQALIQKGEEARSLQLQFSIAREQYLQFVAKDQAASIEASEGRQRLVDVKILGKPWIPESRTSPKTGLYVFLSLVFSFPLGIGIIFVAAFLDHTFDDPSKLESATGLKVLASFEKIKTDKPETDKQ